MRLITERKEVLKRLSDGGREGVPLLCPNAETPDEMEGVLLGAQRHAQASRRESCTVGLGFTATYPDHPQLGGLRIEGTPDFREPEATARRWLHWLSGYASQSGLFNQVEVIPFLDHGWAPHEADQRLMHEPWFQDALGIIMFDASAYEFEDNVRLTAAFVQQAKEHVVVEACPDKVYERGEMQAKNLHESDLWSQPDAVEQFVRRTSIDLIVPNLGTEHRTASATPLEYKRDLAREIARRVGPIQALHGTSSLGGRLGHVGADGICKINYYTAMARAATVAVRGAWGELSSCGSLPISQACGSFIHRTRRAAIADNVAALLALLEQPSRNVT